MSFHLCCLIHAHTFLQITLTVQSGFLKMSSQHYINNIATSQLCYQSNSGAEKICFTAHYCLYPQNLA